MLKKEYIYAKNLEDTYLFNGIKEKEIIHLMSCMNFKIRKYKRGEFILQVGSHTKSLGIVIKGKANIIGEDYWGRKIIFSELKEKDMFAEVYAILEKELEVSVLALSDIEVIWFNIKELGSICAKVCPYHNKLMQNLLISISKRNFKMTNKIRHVAKKTIREKLLSYLLAYSLEVRSNEFEIPFNRQDLADYLFVDRSALSSEITKLKKEGVIEVFKNKFKIKNNLF